MIYVELKKAMERDLPIKLLSLFSGCGGMDLGFEGAFIAHRKSVPDRYVEKTVGADWVLLKKTRFQCVFANDILPEARTAWLAYMSRFGYGDDIFRFGSIVDIVKQHEEGQKVFPDKVDVVVGGFPCQDFSMAGKRKGFLSETSHNGKKRTTDEPTEESRGKLYYWMKQVIDIVRPKIFVAENVKGLVSLQDVKEIIRNDFESADGNGYIVLDPRVLRAADYGVPESRERVIFIGLRKDALKEELLEALQQEMIPQKYDIYPQCTHGKASADTTLLERVTTYDVLKDLAEPELSDDPAQQYYSKAKYQDIGSQGQSEIKLNDLGPTIRSEHHGNIEYRRLSKEHGGTHCEELSRGLQERRLTPRECALIQTFPPDFPFVISNENGKSFKLSPSAAYKVIGNAVPPVMAYNIALRVTTLLDEYFKEENNE